MKPIIFDIESVKAILDGRKRQTRRIVKLPVWSTGDFEDHFDLDDHGVPLAISKNTGCWSEVICPYGNLAPGGHLWVREAWRMVSEHEYNEEQPHSIQYKDGIFKEARLPPGLVYKSGEPVQEGHAYTWPWRSPIHMFKWASRLTLIIEEIRVEQVQNITLTDCIAEGMTWEDECKARASFTGGVFQRDWWRNRWNNINAKRGYPYEDNPWVWVIEFSVNN